MTEKPDAEPRGGIDVALDELEKTATLDEHPEGYDGPCNCKLCQSYGD